MQCFKIVPHLSPKFIVDINFCLLMVCRGTKYEKMRPYIAAGPHRVLTNEVWHQTSMRKDTKYLVKTSRRLYFLLPACR